MNVLESSKKEKRKRESWRKKERLRAGFAGMFLNEGENEKKKKKGGGDRDRTLDMCVEEKNKKKEKKKRNKTYG